MTEQSARYDPLINIARHYRWQIGVLDLAPTAQLSLHSSIDFFIAPVLAEGIRGGVSLPAEFWKGAFQDRWDRDSSTMRKFLSAPFRSRCYNSSLGYVRKWSS